MDVVEAERTGMRTLSLDLDAELVDKARALGLPVESIIVRAIERAVDEVRTPEQRAERARRWREDNADALEERRRLNANGPLPLERWQTLRVPGIASAAFDE